MPAGATSDGLQPCLLVLPHPDKKGTASGLARLADVVPCSLLFMPGMAWYSSFEVAVGC